jgi:hypothetical protein
MLNLFYIMNCLENFSETISLESWLFSDNKKKRTLKYLIKLKFYSKKNAKFNVLSNCDLPNLRALGQNKINRSNW